jgi:putative hydroxymethylpyrimidine transport system substrate-binding protein
MTLALDFQPNPVHAGVYAALRGHLDRRHGLRLTVRAPSASTDSLKLLAAGRSDASIVDIHDLGLARERGLDVVGVGAIVQRPLAAVVARPGIRRPADLEGRRVGVTGVPSDDAVLRSVVQSGEGRIGRVRRTTIGFSAVPSLVSGRVDAVVTFWNAEGVALRRRGVATLRDGTLAALADRPAAVRDIARRSGADEGLTRAQLNAVAPALTPPLRLDRRQLERWAAFDARFGILERRPDVSRAFDLR